MSFYQKLATHAIYQVIARIASSGASFLITIFIARHFGISTYGDFAKITAYVTMFYLLADFGLNAVFLQKEDSHLRFKDLFYTRLLLSGIIIVIANALALLLPYNPVTGIGFSPLVRLGIFIFSFSIFTESMLFSAFAVFQRKILYHKFMIATILGSVVSLVGVFVFGFLGFSLLYIFLAFLLGAAVEAGTMLVFSEEKLTPIRLDIPFAKNLIIETLPVTLMLVFNLIYFRVDMILLGSLKPSVDVALYDIAYRVFDFLISLPLFLSNVLYTRLIEHEKNYRKVSRKYAQYIGLFLLIGTGVVIPMWFLGPIIFEVIKPNLLPATIPFRILLLSLPLFFVTSILQWILLAKKKQVFLAGVYGGLVLVNIVANYIFIPHYSYIASAIITDVCEGGVAIILFIKLFNTK